MGVDKDIIWRAASKVPNPVRYWRGDYVVYNSLSGNTHVLDIVTGEVLRAVMNEQQPARDVCRLLAKFLDVPDDSKVAHTVGQILNQLDELGLIESVGGC